MGRPPGSKNADYEARRAKLAADALHCFVQPNGSPASFRGIARELGVDPRTLRHYFGDVDGLYTACFQQRKLNSQRFRDEALKRRDQPPVRALSAVGMSLLMAWDHGMDSVFNVALVGSLGNQTRGPTVVEHLLEPMIGCAEQLIEHYHTTQQLHCPDARGGALSFLTPILFAQMHQVSLGGHGVRPLDTRTFILEHTQRFVRGCAL